MNASILYTLAAVFFFILGAAVVAFFWALLAIRNKTSHKGITVGKDDSNLTEIARLMRDNQTQDLVVQIDGNTFKSSLELSPPQHRRLSFSSNVLAKWLEQPAATGSNAPMELPAPPESVEKPATPPLVTPPPASDWIPADSDPIEPQNLVVPPFTTESTSEVKPVSTRLPDVVGGILKPAAAPAPAFKSIAMQIDDILQQRITGTPFEKRGITVNDGPDHGVLVTMDGQKFQGVKDVPDEDVRNLIRSAVMEWEKQSKSSK